MNKKPKYVVRLPSHGGCGVLIGQVILTAAHCIKYDLRGGMALGDYVLEEVEAWCGRFKAAVVAVEPVADIAVLGKPDNQEFGDDSTAFSEFCEATKAIRLDKGGIRRRDPLQPFQPVPVRVLNADGRWIDATGEICISNSNLLIVKSERQIEGGASGGPIVNSKGELVAIISNFSTIQQGISQSLGSSPRPLLAVPVWIRRQYLEPLC